MLEKVNTPGRKRKKWE